MSGLIGGVATYTVLFTLVASAAGHLRQPGTLATALRGHRAVPAPALVATAVVTAEGLIGAAVAVAVIRGHGALTSLALAVAGVLFTCYGGYTWYVRSSGRAGSCGCSGLDLPVTGWVVGRAFALAGVAVLGLVTSRLYPVAETPAGGESLPVVLLAGVSFAVLLWLLPAAMYQHLEPERGTG
ncbi:MAG: MauE/DoxX family redox-associated membrane protein [Micromonosporaceae bacterium]